MLFVPYSSMIAIMLWRMPVRIEATTIAAVTPITIPSTVRKLRNLFERTLSSAIRRVSRGMILGSRIFILICLEAGYCPPVLLTRRQAGGSPPLNNRVVSCRLRQRYDRIQSRRFEGRINSGDHADDARNNNRQQNVANRNCHRDAGQGGDQCDNSPRY